MCGNKSISTKCGKNSAFFRWLMISFAPRMIWFLSFLHCLMCGVPLLVRSRARKRGVFFHHSHLYTWFTSHVLSTLVFSRILLARASCSLAHPARSSILLARRPIGRKSQFGESCALIWTLSSQCKAGKVSRFSISSIYSSTNEIWILAHMDFFLRQFNRDNQDGISFCFLRLVACIMHVIHEIKPIPVICIVLYYDGHSMHWVCHSLSKQRQYWLDDALGTRSCNNRTDSRTDWQTNPYMR